MSQPPFNAPRCWGRQYDDSDAECQACEYKDTCRPEVLRQYALSPRPASSSSTSVASRPLPQPVYAAPPHYQLPQPVVPPPPQPFRAPVSVHLPVVQELSPQSPLFLSRPKGDQDHVWWQYPGESAAERLGKNVLLKAGSSIFGEIAHFFTHWTWPKISR